MDLQKFWNKREPMHRWCMPESELSSKMMEDLIEWIRVMGADGELRILDIGSGSGRLFAYLSKEGIDVDVTMIDFTKTALDICEETIGHRPDLWDGEVLPYQDNEFDLVVMMDFVLHVHPDKIRQVLEEAKRVSNSLIYFNLTEWDQPSIKSDTWCFSHKYSDLVDGLKVLLSKEYPAKKKLNAYLMRVERKEVTIMEAIEEQIDDDYLQEVEREDERSTGQDSTFSSDESSVSDDSEVGRD